MRAYTIAVIFIGFLHCLYSIEQKESPLNWLFLFLIVSPFIPTVWNGVSSFKFGSKGVEVEKLKSDVNNAITRVTHGKSLDQKSIETLFKSVEMNDWLTLVLSRMLMRKGLVLLNPDHELGVSPSLAKLINKSSDRELISAEEKEELEKLRDVTFYAEWWGGNSPTQGDWKWALTNCKSIIERLFDKQKIA
jgi:hypothetical protein